MLIWRGLVGRADQIMKKRTRVSSGSSFESLAGYSRAVVVHEQEGDWIFVSGTTGYDYATGVISTNASEQLRQCFRNIEEALKRTDSGLNDIVRVRIYCATRDVFCEITPVIGEICRPFSPANTTVIAELTSAEMLVEVEVTAQRQCVPISL